LLGAGDVVACLAVDRPGLGGDSPMTIVSSSGDEKDLLPPRATALAVGLRVRPEARRLPLSGLSVLIWTEVIVLDLILDSRGPAPGRGVSQRLISQRARFPNFKG
jgi:hypothetical protein